MASAAAPPSLEDRLRQRQRPSLPIVMYQRWRDLLFLHWAFPPEVVQRTLPPRLTVDTFEGQAYVGIVPFFMRAIRPRFLPAVPGISNFMEVNLRTYAHDSNGTPGVWFYSLDANQWLAVQIARAFFKLPYFYATMFAPQHNISKDKGVLTDYTSWRRGTAQRLASRFRYRGLGTAAAAVPGTLDFFLIERYVLFAAPAPGHLGKGHVHHPPYQIRAAKVAAYDTALFELAGFEPPSRPPDHTAVSPGVDVDIYPLTSVAPN